MRYLLIIKILKSFILSDIPGFRRVKLICQANQEQIENFNASLRLKTDAIKKLCFNILKQDIPESNAYQESLNLSWNVCIVPILEESYYLVETLEVSKDVYCDSKKAISLCNLILSGNDPDAQKTKHKTIKDTDMLMTQHSSTSQDQTAGIVFNTINIGTTTGGF